MANHNDNLPTFSEKEVSSHCDHISCWIVIDGKVYDVTNFLKDHPGGYDIILGNLKK